MTNVIAINKQKYTHHAVKQQLIGAEQLVSQQQITAQPDSEAVLQKKFMEKIYALQEQQSIAHAGLSAMHSTRNGLYELQNILPKLDPNIGMQHAESLQCLQNIAFNLDLLQEHFSVLVSNVAITIENLHATNSSNKVENIAMADKEIESVQPESCA